MSTKEIREVLHRAGHEFGGEVVQAALREVEAIEQGAKERSELAEGIVDGDTGALERLVQLAVDERNAAIARQKGSK